MKYTFGKEVEDLIRDSKIGKGDRDAILSAGQVSFDELRAVYGKSDTDKCMLYFMSTLVPVFEVYDRTKAGRVPKTEEYEKLMNRLRAEEEEKEYRQFIRKEKTNLVGDVDSIGKYAFLSGDDADINRVEGLNQTAKEVKHQITTIFNVMITVVSVGYAVWYWSGSSMGLGQDNSKNVSVRLLLSIFASLLVLVAEVVVFGGYLRKVDDARLQERKTVENKKVIQTVVIRNKKSTRAKEQSNKSTRAKEQSNKSTRAKEQSNKSTRAKEQSNKSTQAKEQKKRSQAHPKHRHRHGE